MIAPAIYDNIPNDSLGSFTPDTSKFEKVTEQCEKIYIYHSQDDPVVKFSDSEEYLKLFPDVVFRIFDNKKHFSKEERIFELEEDLKNKS